MAWRMKMMYQIFKIWRYFTSKEESFISKSYKNFVFIKSRLWDISIDKTGEELRQSVINCSEIFTKFLENKDEFINFNSFDCFMNKNLKKSEEYVLEVVYKYKGIKYRIIFQDGFEFPPYFDESQTPSMRMFKKDFKDIDVVLTEYDTIDTFEIPVERQDSDELIYEDTEETELVEEPDMNKLMLQLRGPGVKLFHKDVENTVEWDVLKIWIKKYYLYTVGLGISEKDIKVNMLWSNLETEIF